MASTHPIANLANPHVQQALLGEVLDRAPALVFVADEEMRYVAVNQTACDALGYSREDLLAMRVTDIAVAEDAAELYESMLRFRRQEGVTAIRASDGGLRRFFYNARETKVAGLRYFVSIGFLDEQLPQALRPDVSAG